MNRRLFLGLSATLPLIKSTTMSLRSFLEEMFGITTSKSILSNNFGTYQTVYKVTTGFKSVYYKSLKGNSIDYKLGEFSYPKVGKIFIFKDLCDAEKYSFMGSEILECVGKNISKAQLVLSPGYIEFTCNEGFSPQDIDDYWKSKKLGSFKMPEYMSVALCDALKPIKEI